MHDNEKMKALIIIVNAGFSENALEIARSCGSGGATIINARGTGQQFAKSFIGIHYEPEKELVITLVTEAVAEKIMREVPEKIGSKSAVNGICFCMPVDAMTMIHKNGKKKE